MLDGPVWVLIIAASVWLFTAMFAKLFVCARLGLETTDSH